MLRRDTLAVVADGDLDQVVRPKGRLDRHLRVGVSYGVGQEVVDHLTEGQDFRVERGNIRLLHDLHAIATFEHAQHVVDELADGHRANRSVDAARS